MTKELLRALPKIDEILGIFNEDFLNENGRETVVSTLRDIINENRKAILNEEAYYALTKEEAKTRCEKRLLKKEKEV